ncbi:NUDIX domain-containing protein [filamentous cyanobacterium LEGE 11480]|uniref:NUDIX domain-containing protein n=1 Tax=Romeriopsis navalis LEGE 11480 TaxID=2777977 RepID=A0A928VV18_9CYAN|nr:NUDIX domain-containing protein [Romeriopsis navalis]MBE9032744.1 NUDIX domain-containing protein [Romeriopsis navalis LEGE 11480]
MQFHYLTRAVIKISQKLLLAREIGANYTFLPGVHIELGESAKNALIRELVEELGAVAQINEFLGAVEHTWPSDCPANHEINLLFAAQLEQVTSNAAPRSCESHLEFLWADLTDLTQYNLQPSPVIDLLNFPQTNWGSSFE